MKNLTHLQWFKYLAKFVKVNILINSLECLHIIFVSCFFSATILQYKKLKIEFYFSNESYNEEQEIGSIIFRTSSFLIVRIRQKNALRSASLIFST